MPGARLWKQGKAQGGGPQAEMSVFIACTVQTRGMGTGRWGGGRTVR